MPFFSFGKFLKCLSTTVIPLLVSGIYCRDTANESRYDGSRRYDVGLLSFQRVTLESRKKKMDPSVWALG
ncbi:hypothetical protein [Wolbachia endosymbiont (group A) of Longitarsus flavicornis]|uniref:hypothetical protein n=1 Tax=Wolbachia endosymbiont (group A) of Longitarsus flavicornis TaxID=3066134 RepID=UPI0030CA2698